MGNSQVTTSGDRRASRLLVAALVLAVLVVLAAVVPSPFVVQRPGPVVDAFGTIEAEEGGEVPVVSIGGAETFETSGSLNILSVSIRGSRDRPLAWLSLLSSLFNPSEAITPVDTLFPQGVDDERRNEINQVLMRSSQLSATAAALTELGIEYEQHLSVAEVQDDGPAAGVLREGDVFIDVGGAPVTKIEELRAALVSAGAGSAIPVSVLRDGEAVTLEIVPALSTDSSEPVLGISVATEFEFPFDIGLRLDRIGGPSAGLIFALAITDMLTPGELTGGLTVSGTGTIDAAGRVGAIGGLPQKIWGASEAGTSLFLMPIENCADLPSSLPEGMRVAPVETLDEAVAAISDAVAGRTPAGVERCSIG